MELIYEEAKTSVIQVMSSNPASTLPDGRISCGVKLCPKEFIRSRSK